MDFTSVVSEDVGEFASVLDESKSVYISARPVGIWNNTGVEVDERDHVAVTWRDGTWLINPTWRPPTCGAGGHSVYTSAGSGYVLPGFPEGALVGKIGGDHNGGGSAVFPIGRLGSVPAGLIGTLWLTANDERPGGGGAGFGDNSGSILVSITKTRASLDKVNDDKALAHWPTSST